MREIGFRPKNIRRKKYRTHSRFLRYGRTLRKNGEKCRNFK